MKNLPLGIQTFRDFIKEDYIYVDKTKSIHDLFARGGKYYFLSRPRRFGKSVLISTLVEIFSANKELFKGLWIYDKIQWTQHPVIHLDLSKISFKTPAILEKALDIQIEKIAADYNIKVDHKLFLKEKFEQLVEKLSQKQKVVILVDEYDKPLINYIESGKIETAKKVQEILKSFYGVIKGLDEYLRFVFITGVSKFSRVSVFSDLNNLVDITLDANYSTLLGYTETELQQYFSPFIEQMAEKQRTSTSDLLSTIRKWYNGYSWDGENFVYNPFSILNLFSSSSFENFWFVTGTPTFLINSIKKRKSEPMEFENLLVKSYIFNSSDIGNLNITALLFQTGYLTIKKVIREAEMKTYVLSYPNHEVRDSFLNHLFGEYAQKNTDLGTRLLERVSKAVSAGNINEFIQEIKSLLASIPYQIFMGKKEAYYHSLIYLILRLSGVSVNCEDPTNLGRIDAVLETENKIYIMEFKMGSEKEAISQIKAMKYYEKYLGRGKEIVLLGIAFDPRKRNIGNYLMEILSKE